MKKFLIPIALILSINTFAADRCASMKTLSLEAYYDASSLVEIASHRDASFNVRNICYTLGRLQVNTNMAMESAMICHSGDAVIMEEVVNLSNTVNNSVELCHKKLQADEVYNSFNPIKYRLQKFAF